MLKEIIIDHIQHLYNDKRMSHRAIGEIYGVSDSTIRQFLQNPETKIKSLSFGTALAILQSDNRFQRVISSLKKSINISQKGENNKIIKGRDFSYTENQGHENHAADQVEIYKIKNILNELNNQLLDLDIEDDARVKVLRLVRDLKG